MPVLISCPPAKQEGVATFQMELGSPQPVRTFTLEEVLDARRRLSTVDRQHFYAVIALKQALTASTDALAMDKAMTMLRRAYDLRKAMPQIGSSPPELAEGLSKLMGLPPAEALAHWDGLRPGRRASRDPKVLLSYELSTSLREAQFVLWWNDLAFQAALWCPNLKTALYARALLDIVGGKGIRICPHCSELFIQSRGDQSYCTVAHREAHRVARWRNEQKLKAIEEASKSKVHRRKDGTTKAR